MRVKATSTHSPLLNRLSHRPVLLLPQTGELRLGPQGQQRGSDPGRTEDEGERIYKQTSQQNRKFSLLPQGEARASREPSKAFKLLLLTDVVLRG